MVAGNGQNPTAFTYDSLGRRLGVNVPDGTPEGIQTTTTYSVVGPTAADSLGDGRTWVGTEVRDPNAPVVVSPPVPSNVGRHLSYADSRGNVVAVREFNQTGTETTALTPLTTRYTYDPLDQLLTATDAKGNVFGASYDSVGQMVTVSSPDTGATEFRFDLGGNLREKQTPILRAAAQTIKYEYDFNRIKRIDYPTSADVTYTYGVSGDGGNLNGNRAGRITQVTFDGGSEERFYDSLGNVRETWTTLNRMSTTTGLPASMTFKMKFAYDWLGRMQDMTFPNWIDQNYKFADGEGEKVSYYYDHGGNIDRITGYQQSENKQQTSHPRDFTYLSHVGYDEFEKRSVLKSGNGIANQYVYEAATRRLSGRRAGRGDPRRVAPEQGLRGRVEVRRDNPWRSKVLEEVSEGERRRNGVRGERNKTGDARLAAREDPRIQKGPRGRATPAEQVGLVTSQKTNDKCSSGFLAKFRST